MKLSLSLIFHLQIAHMTMLRKVHASALSLKSITVEEEYTMKLRNCLSKTSDDDQPALYPISQQKNASPAEKKRRKTFLLILKNIFLFMTLK